MHGNGTIIHLHQVLTNHKTQPNTFVVDLGCPPQLSKHLEELLHVFLSDSLAIIYDMEPKHLLFLVVTGHYFYKSS